MKMKPKVRKATDKEYREAESWPIWEKEESEFPWDYDIKETCLILEGKATVRTAEETIEFGAGDYVVFPQGLECTWEIQKKIIKHYKFG